MGIVINNLYDMLKLIESADTYDKTFDHGVCYDLYEDNDPLDVCMTEVQKQIDIVSFNKASYGINLVADIAGFVKKYMHDLYVMSQRFRHPMESDDPKDDDAVYTGITIINALQPGYGADDDYLLLLKKINEEKYWEWIKKYGGDWLEENAEYVEVMWNEVVTDAIDEWPDALPVKEEKKDDNDDD